MIIAHISDTHITLDVPDADKRIADFRAVIDDINTLDPQPDIIIHSGDIVHNGGKADYEVCTSILSQAKAPVYAMVGNKDDRQLMREAFADQGYIRKNSDFIDYSVEGLPIRIIALDTLKPGSNKGTFCEVRLSNLAELIEMEREKPLAVFTHHPPFEVPVGPEPMHFDSDERMGVLCEALQASGRVIGIFSGHVHRFAIGFVGDIPANVMSAVATPLRWGEYSDTMKTRPVYQIYRYDEALGFVTETRILE